MRAPAHAARRRLSTVQSKVLCLVCVWGGCVQMPLIIIITIIITTIIG